MKRPEHYLLEHARRRARKGGYPCSITIADICIPTHCPLLGIRLQRKGGAALPSSPSLDKIKPALGYVPGNVMVVSHRANTIKHNASLAELQTLVKNWSELTE